jgi:hypothetical protein
MSVAGAEGCLPFVTLLDTDKVVCLAKVKLGKNLCILEAVKEF